MAKRRKNHDWYPSGRQNQLNFVKRWISVMSELAEGETTGGKRNYQVWGIPDETFNGLGNAYADAEAAFDSLVQSGTRGGPLNTAAEACFDAMEKITRSVKRRYIYNPPLTSGHFKALGVEERDTIRTPEPVPSSGVKVTVRYGSLHEIILEFAPDGLTDEDVSGFSYNIRFGILAADGKIPERSSEARNYMTKVPVILEDLPGQDNRKRKTEHFRLTALEAGKTFYFSVCYQNSNGAKGPWSEIQQAIIT